MTRRIDITLAEPIGEEREEALTDLIGAFFCPGHPTPDHADSECPSPLVAIHCYPEERE